MLHRRNMFTNLERNMEYNIYCEDAASLIKTIFSCFKRNDKNGSRVKIDLQGKVIDTWDYTTAGDSEEVLVHTTQQWEEKGCLSLTASKDNDHILVKFHYWSSFKKEERNGDEDKYYLGRFTELILVHFYPQIERVEIV